jgi:uncharacterized membrane protein YbhN (UPF0104 family)
MFAWGARALLSALCLGLIAAHVDLAAVLASMASLTPGGLITVAALHLLILVMIAFRWQLVIVALGASSRFARTLGLSFVGTFGNLVLPLNIAGDAMRVLLGPGGAISRGVAIGSVVIDRLIGVLGLAVLVGFVLPWYRAGTVELIVLGSVLGAVAGLPLLLFAFLRATREPRHRAAVWLRRVGTQCAAIRLPPLAAALLLAVLCHAAAVCAMMLIAHDLGYALPLAQGFVMFAGILFAGMLPLSLGGWGLREIASIALLDTVGIPMAAAVSISVLFALVQTVMALGGSIIWLWSDGRRVLPRRT